MAKLYEFMETKIINIVGNKLHLDVIHLESIEDQIRIHKDIQGLGNMEYFEGFYDKSKHILNILNIRKHDLKVRHFFTEVLKIVFKRYIQIKEINIINITNEEIISFVSKHKEGIYELKDIQSIPILRALIEMSFGNIVLHNELNRHNKKINIQSKKSSIPTIVLTNKPFK